MDGEIPNPPNIAEPEQTQSPLKTLSLLKIGLFEILFVSIALILFFGIMNYFNLLPISQIWPNQFGFLPHRQQSNNVKIKQSNNTVLLPSPSLTKQDKQALVDYLPSVLTSSLFATSSSDITFTKEEKIAEGYSAFWKTKENETVKAVFLPSSSGRNIDSLNIAFRKTHLSSPSAEVARTLTTSFLVTPKGEWNCQEIPNSKRLYCENFWEEENGVRRGVGLQGYHPLSTTKESTIFFCEHSQENALYSWKSCSSEFAEGGVE